MGEKGARLTGTAVEVGEVLVEELAPLGEITTKKMFGGVGVFGDGKMFVIIDSEGSVYLRADETTEPEFAEHGAAKHGRMPYWALPDSVSADPDELLIWVGKALAVAKAH